MQNHEVRTSRRFGSALAICKYIRLRKQDVLINSKICLLQDHDFLHVPSSRSHVGSVTVIDIAESKRLIVIHIRSNFSLKFEDAISMRKQVQETAFLEMAHSIHLKKAFATPRSIGKLSRNKSTTYNIPGIFSLPSKFLQPNTHLFVQCPYYPQHHLKDQSVVTMSHHQKTLAKMDNLPASEFPYVSCSKYDWWHPFTQNYCSGRPSWCQLSGDGLKLLRVAVNDSMPGFTSVRTKDTRLRLNLRLRPIPT